MLRSSTRNKRKPEQQVIVPPGPISAKRAQQKQSNIAGPSRKGASGPSEAGQPPPKATAGPSKQIIEITNEQGLVEVEVQYEMA